MIRDHGQKNTSSGSRNRLWDSSKPYEIDLENENSGTSLDHIKMVLKFETLGDDTTFSNQPLTALSRTCLHRFRRAPNIEHNFTEGTENPEVNGGYTGEWYLFFPRFSH
jgi:hypothetical protein